MVNDSSRGLKNVWIHMEYNVMQGQWHMNGQNMDWLPLGDWGNPEHHCASMGITAKPTNCLERHYYMCYTTHHNPSGGRYTAMHAATPIMKNQKVSTPLKLFTT